MYVCMYVCVCVCVCVCVYIYTCSSEVNSLVKRRPVLLVLAQFLVGREQVETLGEPPARHSFYERHELLSKLLLCTCSRRATCKAVVVP